MDDMQALEYVCAWETEHRNAVSADMGLGAALRQLDARSHCWRIDRDGATYTVHSYHSTGTVCGVGGSVPEAVAQALAEQALPCYAGSACPGYAITWRA